MIKISYDIPMPETFRYPWHDVKIGGSFEFTGSNHQAHKRCAQMSKATGKLFKARVYKGELRVWRVA